MAKRAANSKAKVQRGIPRGSALSPPISEPPKRIVIFCDGTGNSASKQFKTNVWRLYRALDMESNEQIATFADGVGTSSFRPLAVIGLALGFGVKSRVINLYKFLCLNYRAGDDIYVFGFSRGAFIARVLVGMIFREGLVKRTTSEQLDTDARAAYRSYRRRAFKVAKLQFWVHASRALIDAYQWAMRTSTGQGRLISDPDVNYGKDIPIRFLGVWDTVAAYGLPIEELTDAVDRWVWPMTFASNNLLDSVQYARQAFSIDDERRTFFPIAFNEDEALTAGENPRLRQVWFAGSHSNVGGGYPDDRLAMLPLCWMIGEAAKRGLKFDAETVADYWDEGSPNGRIYDQRAGASLFYRYHPRPVEELMRPKKDGKRLNVKVTPLVDSSVIRRIARGPDDYAPVDLPTSLNVLSPVGRVDEYSVTQRRRIPAPALPSPLIDPLPQPADRNRNLVQAESELQSAKQRLRGQTGSVVAQLLEHVKNLVWWRKVNYFTTLSIVLVFALFPLVAGYLTKSDIDTAGSGIVGPVIGVVSGFLPRFLDPWLKAFTDYAGRALGLAMLLGFSLWLNARLATRIRDRARAAWDVNLAIKQAEIDVSRHGATLRSILNAALAFGAIALLARMIGNGAAGYIGAVSAACFAAYGLMGIAARLKPKMKDARPPALLQDFAASWRTDANVKKVSSWVTRKLGPAAFLLFALVFAIAALNKVSFEVLNAAGVVCGRPVAGNNIEDLTVESEFPTSGRCWSTGAFLKAGVTYRINMTIKNDWKDRNEPTDVRGFQAGDAKIESSGVFYAGNLFKRWWGEPYFKPVARVGRRGNEEYALDQIQPADAAKGAARTLFAHITPASDGPLYLYVNDIGLAVLPWTNRFYANNQGTATVEVVRDPDL